MSKRDAIRWEDLTSNGGPYLPICMCLDTSRSMERKDGGTSRESGSLLERIGPTRLELLMQGVREFYQAIYADELTRYTAEVAIVTFDDTARVIKDFSRVEQLRRDKVYGLVGEGMEDVPKLQTNGTRTAMGEGVNMALDLLDACKQTYKERAVDYYQPWLVLISDGMNNGDSKAFEEAQNRIRDLVGNHKLAVYPLAVGSAQGLACLNALSPAQEAFSLHSVALPSLFKWLAASAEEVSSGAMGTYKSPKLERARVITWAEAKL